MAQNDDAVFTASRGFIFTAPINTAAPTPADIDAFDPESPALTGFTDIGHTSDDDLPEFGFDGGDTEVRGSWQNQALREVVTEALADYMTFNLLQFDKEGLSLYYGVTDPGATDGVFEVGSNNNPPIERALVVVIVDGNTKIAFHAGRTGIRREDAIQLDPEGFAALPLRATFLKGTGPLFSWISNDTEVNVVPEEG
jgi:hypothetical protein